MANFNQPKRSKIIDAYRNGTDEQKKVLVELFGEIEPKNIMERVKTFEDACRELGKDHEYVKDYRALGAARINVPADVLSYYKIRIICAALNEGWTPDYTDSSQYKYYPWIFYAEEDFVKSHPKEKWHKLCHVGGYANHGSHCGSFCVTSDTAFATSDSAIASRLAYKTRELAIYAGNQFFDIYADYLIK
jgi:hypothetical protein